ncbi:OmpA family protein [Oceanobacillus sp. Castelsardo]|uniref:OmpA family protein n=1 Tax=Oceanobacillus sp. Castelsardo TaxID=1851204 RepID=UPI001E414590|nr:OmpA family protein [Oceanobacillus sp. Castelsardo]
MKGKVFITLFLTMLIIFLTGCNSEGTETSGDRESKEVEKESVEAEETNATEELPEKEKEEVDENLEKVTKEPEKEMDKESENETEDNENDIDQSIGDYHIVLGGEMVETEDAIQIHGKSNLIPGARVIGEVSVGEEEYFADSTELVQEDGSFYLEIPHHDLKKETKVEVKFHFDGHQDDAIIRHYGDRGQELTGPYIYKHEGEVGGGSPQNIYQMAKVETTFVPGEELAVRQFKEPDWHPTPEDMGDPRVWMEVLEINNDEAYFYLHGKSNLLEGSKLRGKYAGSNAEASVKPDGSFDMMFEYEYKEDASFVIEFDPAHWSQWNIIEETYGAKGQKLVGNLVEKNKYNDNQSIVIEEKLESTEISVPDNVELKIDGPEVTMLVPDHLLFDFDEFELKEESKNLLAEIGKTLQTFDKDIEIEISGHTDNVGDSKYNQELSEKRAEEVKAYLMDQGELSEANMTTVGHGETKPISSNENEKGQAKNRRVEIIINLR